jgi:hypothetical protein
VPYFVSALEDSAFYLNDGEASNEAAAPDSAESAAPAEPASNMTPPKKKTVAKKPSVAKPKSVNNPPAPQPAKATRPDAKTFSYQIWPEGGLRSNFRTKQSTQYGKLSCVATVDPWSGTENSNSRKCRWE